MTVAPGGSTAAVHWAEQDCSGFLLAALANGGDRQLPEAGYRTDLLCTEPVFSPGGEYIVASCSRRDMWWSPEAWELLPAVGGAYMLGHIVIYTVATHSYVEVPLIAEVPAGWLPAEEDTWVCSEPHFLSDREFSVTLPTGADRRFHVE